MPSPQADPAPSASPDRPPEPQGSASPRWVPWAGLTLVLGQALFFLLLAGGDVSRLVHAAPPFTDPAAAPQSLTVGPTEDGFDGQFFYRQAQAPVSTAASVSGITFDLPALRSARVGYPLLAAALSVGQQSLLPWALVAVNVLAGALLVAVVAKMAAAAGHHPAWGLVALAYPGFVYTIGLDLAELTAVTLLAAGMLAARRQSWLLVAALWSAAVLTRESAAVLPLSAALVVAFLLVRRRPVDRGLALAAAAPLVVAVGWQLVLGRVFGEIPVLSSGGKNIGLPLQGLVSSAAQFAPTSADGLFRLASLGCLIVLVAVGATCLRSSAALLHEKVALVVAAVVVSTLSPFVWAGATSFMRAAAELSLFATVVVATAPGRLRLLVPLAVGATMLLTLLSQLVKA